MSTQFFSLFSKRRQLPARNQAGFTLMELLIVIVIIGLLSTVGLGSFVSSQVKSRDARRKSDLKQISNALELYYNDHGQYPSDSSGRIVGCGSMAAPSACEWGAEFQQTNVAGTTVIFMAQLPEDPSGAGEYYYSSDAVGSYFQLYARLENNKDSAVPKSGATSQYYSGGVDAIDCGSLGCNYGVSSPNVTPATGRTLQSE